MLTGGRSPALRLNHLRRFRLPHPAGRERPATQAKTVQWTVFSESPSSYAAKAKSPATPPLGAGLFILSSDTKHHNQNNNRNKGQHNAVSNFCKLTWV